MHGPALGDVTRAVLGATQLLPWPSSHESPALHGLLAVVLIDLCRSAATPSARRRLASGSGPPSYRRLLCPTAWRGSAPPRTAARWASTGSVGPPTPWPARRRAPPSLYGFGLAPGHPPPCLSARACARPPTPLAARRRAPPPTRRVRARARPPAAVPAGSSLRPATDAVGCAAPRATARSTGSSSRPAACRRACRLELPLRAAPLRRRR